MITMAYIVILYCLIGFGVISPPHIAVLILAAIPFTIDVLLKW